MFQIIEVSVSPFDTCTIVTFESFKKKRDGDKVDRDLLTKSGADP